VTYERTVEKLNKAGEVVARITEVRYQPPDWRADAWHLERRYPKQWGRRAHGDMRLTIQRLAEKVAAEATAAEVLAEAQALLDEIDCEGDAGTA
jgi:hypothetical protein